MAFGEILGGISAIAGLAGSASAASAQQKAYEEQKEAAKAQAKATNKYNKKKFKANKKFTKEMREYNFQTAMTRWRYDEDLRKREYGMQMKAYNKDQENLANTLKMNNIAARQGYISEQRVMNEIAQEQSFQRMDSYIAGIQAEGRAALGSAGQSNDRAVSMTAAEHGRNLAIMDASFTSAIAQHNMNMFDIALNKFGADLTAKANAMLKPEELPGIPEPVKPPLPEFIKPLKIKPNYVPRPNTTGTIMNGILGAAQGIAGMAGAFGTSAGSTPSAIPGGSGIGSGLGGGTGGWTYEGPSFGTSGMTFDWN